MEYNILKIAGGDTWTFFYIAVTITLGVGLFIQALKMIYIRNMSNVVLIIFGGILPAILALRVKYWMVYTCRQPQLLQDISMSKLSFVQDVGMLIVTLVGFALILSTFSEMQIETHMQTDNITAACFSLLSGIFLGLGLAEIRIVCRFKNIRALEGKQNYYFLKPLFWTLLTSQMVVPAFMYPSLATQGEQGHKYSGKKMLFFILSAILISIMLCSIGAALQHSEISNGSINLCFTTFPTVIMLLFDFFLLNKAG